MQPKKKPIAQAAAAICVEAGFSAAEKLPIELLAEMLHSCLIEIGRLSRAYAEVAGRTQVTSADVCMALIENGYALHELSGFIRRQNKITLTPSAAPIRPAQLKILSTNERMNLPPHIPSHFPSLPDTCAYIRTPTHKQPVTEYEAIREKVATQKRDVERALTRFIAKTGSTHFLFPEDRTLFPLIPCKFMTHPYLEALLPKDQLFEDDEETETKEPEKPPVPPSTPGVLPGPGTPAVESGAGDGPHQTEAADIMDNPFLRPVKLPRKSSYYSRR